MLPFFSPSIASLVCFSETKQTLYSQYSWRDCLQIQNVSLEI